MTSPGSHTSELLSTASGITWKRRRVVTREVDAEEELSEDHASFPASPDTPMTAMQGQPPPLPLVLPQQQAPHFPDGDSIFAAWSPGGMPPHPRVHTAQPNVPQRPVVTFQLGPEEDALSFASPSIENEEAPMEWQVDGQVVLSILVQQKRLGCAYVDLAQQCLHVLGQDLDEDIHLSITDMCTRICRHLPVNSRNCEYLVLAQMAPSHVIASARSSEALLHHLRKQSEIKFVVCAASDYSLSNLKLLPGRRFPASKSEQTLSLRCVVGLLSFLSKNSDVGLDRSLSVETFTLEKLVHVTRETLFGLQIFEDEAHPSTYSGRDKEGFSLFGISPIYSVNSDLDSFRKQTPGDIGLLNHTLTSLGKNQLRNWLLRPTNDPEILCSRHDLLRYFLHPSNVSVMEEIRESLRGIKNIPYLLASMKKHMRLSDLQSILKFTFHALKIKTSLEGLCRGGQVQERLLTRGLLADLLSSLDASSLQQIGTKINHFIDFDESELEGRIVVKPDVDQQLDELKRMFAGLESLLAEVAKEVAAELPKTDAYQDMQVVYIPQLGYLVTLPAPSDSEGSNVKELKLDVPETFEFQFHADDQCFFKNGKMRELDESLGDMHGLIVDREIEIAQELHESLASHEKLFQSTTVLLADLDCILSLAVAARKNNYTEPKMVETPTLNIEGGRHPLQEVCNDTFVKNDIHVSADTQPMALLTGPNFSGKSVFLKQIALIVYMAHIGSFVPADRATIGFVDKIFSRIQTRETVSKNESAFMIDLKQVLQAVKLSTPRSLILLDEFGKGTLLSDGIGLLCGLLREFALRDDSPLLLAATHFHELFHDNLLEADVTQKISFQTMQVLQNEDDSLTFLYRLRPGRAESSLGIHCAKAAGIPEPILARATEITQKLMNRSMDGMQQEGEQEEMGDESAHANIVAKFLSMDLNNGSAITQLRQCLAPVL